MAIERQKELRRQRHRRAKVRKLQAKLKQTTDPRQRAALIRKITAVSPTSPVPEK